MGDLPGVVSELAKGTDSSDLLAELAISPTCVPSLEIARNEATRSETLLQIAQRQHPPHSFDTVMEVLAQRDAGPELLDAIGRRPISRRAALSLLQNLMISNETILFIANSPFWYEGTADIGLLAQSKVMTRTPLEQLVERRFTVGGEGAVTYDGPGRYKVRTQFKIGNLSGPERPVSMDDSGVLTSARTDELVERESDKDRVVFRIEDRLEEFLVFNWSRIGFFADYDLVGQQYRTDSGPIDILARSKDKKRWLVIELKRGKPRDQAVGQVLRYMGWAERALMEPGHLVEGLIVGTADDQRLRDTLKFTREGAIRYVSYHLTIELS
ncbi:hypothetical protein C3E77_08040 [Mycetocola zhujimingii]|nr:hypothetical protein C3E77_08040 [Mycetocola zhujimingii]